MAGKKNSKLKISLKLKKVDGTVSMYHSGKTRRIIAIIKRENFLEAYLKVSYGKHSDIFGNYGEHADVGTYTNKKELLFALECLCEKRLVDEKLSWP